MSKAFKVIATPTFKITLQKLCAFLNSKYGAEVATAARDLIKLKVAALSRNPYSGPVSERLSVLGFNDYRQLLIDQHSLVYYRVDNEENRVVLVVVMDSRQSVAQLLYETTIKLD
ncbi:Uncharacterised protein [Zhongshania aliphaticivorans]|uniref:Plasmid stabilization protein n=1 Tax=Zhongshania aliphaticivorans TaxID=1470434 RepID=A0A5S9PDV5_9GAMM|nr:type II toxin-antitoxin system RelE/ParE family toxin [Zhongshania aliphaticivorans]CAA0078572.1 Uncharacterised protein [Zhongshania aliphaticivorans]CAA0086632.1 Uncharacterised protein [Zhongshania aliphaticivorans]CAA0102155.1 Uncharacterised protein [Zhongshania aliphaticivorans]